MRKKYTPLYDLPGPLSPRSLITAALAEWENHPDFADDEGIQAGVEWLRSALQSHDEMHDRRIIA